MAGEAFVEGGHAVAGALPVATVTPTSVEEVVEVVKAASMDAFGVVPKGGGTDLGPVPPTGPFVVLSTVGLKGVEAYEPADLTLSGRAGTTLRELADVTAPHGQWLPFDPPFLPARTLGGLAATGARGPLSTSYGAPRDHVLGLTLVTGDGRVLRLGGRVMKNVAGFDLVKLAVGSRGTLGVVVSVTVRLFPRPEREIALVLDAPRTAELVAAARAVATAPVLPASAIVAAGPRDSGDGGIIVPRASLVVRLGGAPETVAADAVRLQEYVGRPFRSVEGSEAFALFAGLRDHAATGETVVRISALPAALGDLVAGVESLPGPTRMLADIMAGRVRVTVADTSGDALSALASTAATLGGSCTLERGPVELLPLSATPDSDARVRTLTSALRQRFDPRGVLWPRKTT